MCLHQVETHMFVKAKDPLSFKSNARTQSALVLYLFLYSIFSTFFLLTTIVCCWSFYTLCERERGWKGFVFFCVSLQLFVAIAILAKSRSKKILCPDCYVYRIFLSSSLFLFISLTSFTRWVNEQANFSLLSLCMFLGPSKISNSFSTQHVQCTRKWIKWI